MVFVIFQIVPDSVSWFLKWRFNDLWRCTGRRTAVKSNWCTVCYTEVLSIVLLPACSIILSNAPAGNAIPRLFCWACNLQVYLRWKTYYLRKRNLWSLGTFKRSFTHRTDAKHEWCLTDIPLSVEVINRWRSKVADAKCQEKLSFHELETKKNGAANFPRTLWVSKCW